MNAAVSDNVQTIETYAKSVDQTRKGAAILLLGLLGFGLWAAFAPLDEGVPTEGVISVESNHKVVQHLTGGIVSALQVHEGQEVQAGDVLFKLDAQASKARYEEVWQRYAGLRAQEDRLRAEQSHRAAIDFHPDLTRAQQDPLIQQQMRNQSQLLFARTSALAADIAGKKESIAGYQALIEGYRGVLSSHESQLALLEQQLQGVRALTAEGYAPRNQQNDLEQRVAALYGERANTQANITRAQRAILELQQQITQRNQSEQKEIDADMAQVKLQVEADAQKVLALRQELGRTEIRSPAAGQVVGLQVHTVGAVIQPGQKLMDIVPSGEALIVDAQIPPHLIDKMHVGQAADIRFSTFANSPQLLAEGQLKSLSKDLLSKPAATEEGSQSYYLARVILTKKGMQALQGRQLQPGMPVQVVIKTGERTLWNYLMHPLSKRLAASMKEE
ncbi:HlyD family type I secretion periplasmic adaptor subunit [Methylophilus medardicus]|uniref:Membrane fusion protein (MFP) family protein n=2 Tax=Methylophilus medardicus TaxID=2588534 RepID=A0A5B8CVD9_9PROT|nr:HlyD family type I secretion periplasmic adaptor subunit [Methylophilus medardicus]QDC50294.1 HlyD family type I secretion periplasmic adaptor subunit [Methylophilus medardicus]QDC53999.1 HlyD family type I secretion periplasmic adaptor subunit [Methylophilus medardicus]